MIVGDTLRGPPMSRLHMNGISRTLAILKALFRNQKPLDGLDVGLNMEDDMLDYLAGVVKFRLMSALLSLSERFHDVI